MLLALSYVIVEETTDKQPRVWALYKPEPEEYVTNNAQIHMWFRRFELFTYEALAKKILEKRIGMKVIWQHHNLFPELQLGTDERGFRWLLEPVPIAYE